MIEKNRVFVSAETTAVYIYGLNGAIAKRVGNTVLFLLKDHLGSTRVVMDGSGLVRSYYDYDAFGNLIRTGTTNEVKYQFTGQEYDESGLHNYRARLYDSDLGKFYAVDPAGQFASPFAYAGNNPVIMVDPDGRVFWVVAGAVVGAYLGASLANDWQFDPGKWAWNKGKTYAGLVVGAVIGGYAGANLAYAYNTTGIDFSLNGITVGTLTKGGAITGSGIATGYLGYQALRADRENEPASFERDFLTETSLHFDAYGVGEDNYEGVPITAHDYGNLGRFEYLPDGSLFRDPVSGGILNVNAEEWIYRAGGSDVPWWGDPVNWVAFGTSPLRRSFVLDISPGKIDPFHIGIKTIDASRKNLVHVGYHKQWGWHLGVWYERAKRGWTTWKHFYFFPPRIWP